MNRGRVAQALCAQRNWSAPMRTLLLLTGLLSTAATCAQTAPSDIEQVRATLMDYIEGTANRSACAARSTPTSTSTR